MEPLRFKIATMSAGRDAVEAAVAQDRLNRLALGWGAVLQRVQHRHGGFAFAQVAGDRLAQNFFRRGQVEHVVDDLERHAEVASVFGKPLLIGFAGVRQNAAHLHADRKQAGRLAVNELEMFFQRDGFAEPLDLQQFAFDHGLGQIDERVEDVKIALLHGDLEGLHVEPVAGEDALGVAPLRVGCGTAAARLGFVDDVVVDQRRGVDDFHHRSQLDRALAGVVHQLAGEQQAVQDAAVCRRRREGIRRSP